MTDLFSLEPNGVIYLTEGQATAFELLTDRLSFTIPATLCADPNSIDALVSDLNQLHRVLTPEQREALVALYHRTFMLIGNAGINSTVTIEVLQRLLVETWSGAQLADSMAAIANRTLAHEQGPIDHVRTIALYFRAMLPLTAKMLTTGGNSAVAATLGIHERVMTEVFTEAWDAVLLLAGDALGSAEARNSTDMLTVLLRNLLVTLTGNASPEHLEDVTHFLAEHVRLHMLMDEVVGTHRAIGQVFYQRTARAMELREDGRWTVTQLDGKSVSWAGSKAAANATVHNAVLALVRTEQGAPSTTTHAGRGNTPAPCVIVARYTNAATIVHNLTPGRTRGFLNLRSISLEAASPSELEVHLEDALWTLLKPWLD